MLVTANLEALNRVSCIKYSIQFQAQHVQAMGNFRSKVNAMTLASAAKLSLSTQSTHVGTHKIDGCALKT